MKYSEEITVDGLNFGLFNHIDIHFVVNIGIVFTLTENKTRHVHRLEKTKELGQHHKNMVIIVINLTYTSAYLDPEPALESR